MKLKQATKRKIKDLTEDKNLEIDNRVFFLSSDNLLGKKEIHFCDYIIEFNNKREVDHLINRLAELRDMGS